MAFKLQPLKTWFLDSRRSLPWRQNPTPYQVWVSEVMLQQTQVAVVIPYFERWMKKFPTVTDLSKASLDEVLKMWEGLGYYSRARSLYEGAKKIVTEYGGRIPESVDELKTIKGLGPYTIGAILNFGFKKKAVAVDGNVMRVLSRLFLFEKEISKPASQKEIRNFAWQLIEEEKEHWIINEALIELGATICTKSPKCHLCPLRSQCLAFKAEKEHDLPLKGKKTLYENLYRSVAVCFHGRHLLVTKGQKGAIMQDLYEFPYFASDEIGVDMEEFKNSLKSSFKLSILSDAPLPTVEHSFTKYRVKLFPVFFKLRKKSPIPKYEWKSVSDLQNLAFSSGHLRIFKQLIKVGLC